jgi:hypothetical protein
MSALRGACSESYGLPPSGVPVQDPWMTRPGSVPGVAAAISTENSSEPLSGIGNASRLTA